MSYKACTSTNKEPAQSMDNGLILLLSFTEELCVQIKISLYFLVAPDEVTTPMSTRSRTYNTRTNSSRQPVQAARRYLLSIH